MYPNSVGTYVAVEGIIGVGKTTLVERLASELKAQVVLESFEDNPFLSSFYADPDSYALSTQLFFLMSRYHQQEAMLQADLFERYRICDYLFEKDQLFAELNLQGDELSLYSALFEALSPTVPRPDRVIYLRADLDVVLQRIEARGRSYEANFDPVYLARLARAYDSFFAQYRGCRMRVDTTDIDLRSNEPTWRSILDFIETGIAVETTRDSPDLFTAPAPTKSNDSS